MPTRRFITNAGEAELQPQSRKNRCQEGERQSQAWLVEQVQRHCCQLASRTARPSYERRCRGRPYALLGRLRTALRAVRQPPGGHRSHHMNAMRRQFNKPLTMPLVGRLVKNHNRYTAFSWRRQLPVARRATSTDRQLSKEPARGAGSWGMYRLLWLPCRAAMPAALNSSSLPLGV